MTQENPNLVEIENLHFAYGDRAILRGIDMQIKRGEVAMHVDWVRKTDRTTDHQPTQHEFIQFPGSFGQHMRGRKAPALACAPQRGHLAKM